VSRLRPARGSSYPRRPQHKPPAHRHGRALSRRAPRLNHPPLAPHVVLPVLALPQRHLHPQRISRLHEPPVLQRPHLPQHQRHPPARPGGRIHRFHQPPPRLHHRFQHHHPRQDRERRKVV